MCTRYFISSVDPYLLGICEEALERQKRIFETDNLKTDGEIFPNDIAPVLTKSRGGDIIAFPMQFGMYLPETKKLILNARSETADRLPMFAESFKLRRCIIPCSCYFEWQRKRSDLSGKAEKIKYAIQPEGADITYLAGLYRLSEDGVPKFVILTRPPAENIAFIHDRMPLIIPAQYRDEWIFTDDPGRFINNFKPFEISYKRSIQ